MHTQQQLHCHLSSASWFGFVWRVRFRWRLLVIRFDNVGQIASLGGIKRRHIPAVQQGALSAAEAFVANTPDSFMLRQFENKHNPRIHYETTGPEIWNATGGEIDILISGE